MRNLYFICLLFLLSCNNNVPGKEESLSVSGDYFGDRADTIATMFAEGIISRQYQELNSVFSPDMQEFYFTLATPDRSFYSIVYYKKDSEGNWQGPQIAPFSGTYSDADPYFSSDGNTIYFISKRPLSNSGNEKSDFDIWKASRIEEGWSDPVRLDSTINTSQNEYYVSATDDGSIFWSARYDGGYGGGDIYQAIPEGNSYSVINLGPSINSSGNEGDPYVSPDGKMIIFLSLGREDELGGGDLYMSQKVNGEWQPARNLGSKINSQQFEYCPMMSPDGNYFFWTSYRSSPFAGSQESNYSDYVQRLDSPDNGLGNIFWIKSEILYQD